MQIYTSEDIKLIQKFKENAFKSVLRQIKGSTSWRNKKNLEDNFKEYGFTGHYAFLREFYEDNESDMLEAIYLLWDTID